MEKQKLQHFKDKLLTEKKRLQEVEESFEQWGGRETMDIAITELSAYDQHPADTGSQLFDRELDLGLRENVENRLEQVNHALSSIEQGTYGNCERCGRKIDEARLETLPYTSLCISCKEDDEKQESPDVSARPVEEDVLGVPFSRSFKDGEDFAAYDGEDAWQDVAKFGTANSPQDIPDAIEYDETYVDADEDQGIVSKIEGVQDEENTQAANFEEIYPEPQANNERRRYKVPQPRPAKIKK